jgi:hypothetical protein
MSLNPSNPFEPENAMNPTPKPHKHAELIKQWADAPEDAV